VQTGEEVAGGEEVAEGCRRPQFGKPKPAAGREQPPCVQHRREPFGEPVAFAGRLRRLEFPAFHERLGQYGEGGGGVNARQARGLERDTCVRLGVGEVANAEVHKGR
jgi:hypothetical protein